jgi:hypothetical protein
MVEGIWRKVILAQSAHLCHESEELFGTRSRCVQPLFVTGIPGVIVVYTGD